MLKLIVLDFDGVVVESNDIKDRAFDRIFSKYPEHYEHMMEYHLSHNATDRVKKFTYFVNDVLKISDQQGLIEDLVKRFNDFTLKQIKQCPYVEGALDFLEYVYKRLPVYLASATPDKELKEILVHRKLLKYFKNVYGSSKKKVDVISDLLAVEDADRRETLYIGDSPEDYKTAKKTDVYFIGRISDRNLGNITFPVYNDMKEILMHIKDKFHI